MDYQKAYFYLFAQISDWVDRLVEIQQRAEELCIGEDNASEEDPPSGATS